MVLSSTSCHDRYFYYTLDIKFEHLELECVPDALEVRLPSLLTTEHGVHLPPTVELFDGSGNKFEVRVTPRGSDIYFTQGWRNIGRSLGLRDGGWIRMIYVAFDRFFIEARDRLLNVPFLLAPPRIFSLGEAPRMVQDADSIVRSMDPSMYVGRKPTVVFTLHATLTATDVSTSFLHIPYAFSQVAFPRIDCDVTLVDEDGKAWSCSLIFPSPNMEADVLLRGWGSFMDANEFPEGSPITLQVPVDKPQLIFFGAS